MASELGWVGLGVSPDFTGFKGKVESESSKAMRAAGVSGGAAFGESAGRSAGDKFKSGVKAAAKVAAVGLAAVGAVAFKFGKDSLAEAREAQKVGALTASTIKATGGAAKVTAKHVGDLSEKISEQAGVDDEIIQRGANMLLTFKNVRNEAGKGGKIFDRTTQAITDMAAGMAGGKGGELDLKSASILMGKALNDPVAGLSALNRVGVQFSEQQKAINLALVEGGNINALNAIGLKVTTAEFTKAMEDHKRTAEEQVRVYTGPLSDAQQKYFDHLAEGGHTLEAQQNILKEVNSQFKGAAAAQATDAEKMQVAWGNFKEEVGNELLPVMDDLARFLTKKGIPKAREFFGWIKDTGVPAIKDLKEDLEPAAGHLKDFVGYLNDLPKDIKLGGLAGVLGLIGAAKLRGGKGGLLGGAGSALGMSRPLPVVVTNPGFGAGGVGAGAGGAAAGGAAAAGSKFKGRFAGKSGALVAIASISPWIADEIQAEIDYFKVYMDQHTYHGSSGKHPQDNSNNLSGGAGLASLLASPMGKFGDTKGQVKALGDEWVIAGSKADRANKQAARELFHLGGVVREQRGKVSGLGIDLERVGNKKVRPQVEVQGIDRARSQLRALEDDLNTVASLDITGLSGLAAAGVAGMRRNRRRNLGGMP